MAMTSSISLLGSNFQSLAMTLLMIPTIVLTEMMRTIRRSWLIIIDGSELNAKKTPRMGLDWIYISKWRFDHVWLIITRITIKAWVSSHYWVTVLMTLAVVRGREDDKPDDTNGSTKSCNAWFSKNIMLQQKRTIIFKCRQWFWRWWLYWLTLGIERFTFQGSVLKVNPENMVVVETAS